MPNLKEKVVGEFVVREASYRQIQDVFGSEKKEENLGEELVAITVFKDGEPMGDAIFDESFPVVNACLKAALELNGLSEDSEKND